MGLLDLLNAYGAYKRYKAMGDDRPSIAFYSEMGSDRIYFEGIMRRLIQDYNQKILYFTSGKNDPLLKEPPDGRLPFYVGEGMVRTMLFMELDVPLFVMTLSDLDTLLLKRSPYGTHYAYIFHSLVSTHMVYRHGAFDGYDTLFCVGPHHEREIREAEKIFNTPAKTFVQHGYPRIDKIMADYQTYLKKPPKRAEPDTPNIVVAPSWGVNSISDRCANALVEILLNQGYYVTFRPHPMTLRQQKNMRQVMEARFKKYEKFAFDDDIANTRSLFEADIMICDWSGVALEFGLGTEKPIVFIDVPPKRRNDRFSEFKAKPIEDTLRTELGVICAPDALQSLPETIEALIRQKDVIQQRIATLREATVYNIGKADEVGARELMKLLEARNTQKSPEAKVPETTPV